MKKFEVEMRQYRDSDIWSDTEVIEAASTWEAAAVYADYLRDQLTQFSEMNPAEIGAWLGNCQFRVSDPGNPYCWGGVIYNYADCADIL